MREVALRSLLATVIWIAALALPAWPHAALAQEDDAAYLAEIVGARAAEEPVGGPLSGILVQQADYASVDPAGVEVTDFTARVVFQNPGDDSVPWDFGFDFGRDGEASQRIMVDSTGAWRYSPYPVGDGDFGPAPTLDTTPGSVNTLDLVVNGETGILGINGEYVTTISLPAPAPSDVFVTTGVYASTAIVGRELHYEDFTVWALLDLSAVADASPTPTGDIISLNQAEPEQTPEPAQDDPITQEDVDTFEFLLQAQSTVPPVAGPFTANLKEEPGPIAASWANVDLADFHATATFTVPDTTSDVPWDIGFMFRISPEGTLRVSVDQDGTWYASAGENAPASLGTVTGLDATPGAENTLDLLVLGDHAVLGINGVLAARIDLPEGGTASDVAAGAGFYTDQQLPGRVTLFRDFVVRPFDPDALETTPPPTEPATFSPEAEQQFAGYVASSGSIAPLVGPLSGALEETGGGTVALAGSGVSLADFGAVATFVNPDDLSGTWDGGIQFRTDANGTNRIVLRSNGQVQVVQGNGTVAIAGLASSYDATPGAANTLQVFVAGNQALVGVNGTLVADITLAVAPVAGDVQVGAGFFGEDQLAGRVTIYDGFSVWSIA